MSRVLVIDDESIVATILRHALDQMGHQTLAADDGRSGLEVARAEHPDVIVLDLVLPPMSGVDVLVELREDRAIRSTPIVVLTGVTMAREHHKALSSGADVVMTKPFDPQDVADVVGRLLLRRAGSADGGGGSLPG